ncbi:unnamed protein product [Soboliphyme baturini]|uniref:Miro domain-containing protein n=1 Tax=Soboliphyme baturini TaxID=241478 RepID=A0A3P8BJI5_9BILA|nr:unnamed protein product [Soboliphyme baturini]
MFIQRGKHETTWTVLRNFGYDNALNLCTEYLYPRLNVPQGCSAELNSNGIMFLTALFQKYDEDKDGCLSPVEVHNLFSVCPLLTWPAETYRMVETNEKGWITYQGFLSCWMLTTLLDYNQMFEYLAYFGYNDAVHNQTSAVTVTRDKRTDWQKKFTERNVFRCQVIGSKDAGKTSLLQGFIGNDVQRMTAVEKAALPRFTANSLNVCGQEKYLVMHEIDVLAPEETLCTYELQCDVVCLVYDVSNPHSFEYFATIYKARSGFNFSVSLAKNYFHRTRIPCLVVGTKCDCREVLQQFECQPYEFCKKNHLPPPVKYSATMTRSSNVFVKIATLANYPHIKHIYYLHDSSTWLKFSVAAAAAAFAGFIILRHI